MWKEFKEFALKGNVMDLAIGVVIGGAFQKVVTSLVEDVIMPLITVFTGKVDYSELVIEIGQTSIKYGSFITTIINFLIIAFSIFFAIKYVNRLNVKLAKTKEKENEKLEKLKQKREARIEKLKNKNELNKYITKKIEKIKEKQKVEETATEPTTKQCPYCFTEINIKATRCPHCTSELQEKID